MKLIITSEKVPIKSWVNKIEVGAMHQAENIANLPFIFKHVSLMPDSHQGMGVPIGTVFATKGVLIPNAVGVDIGCGMLAIKTSLNNIDLNDLYEIRKKIIHKIPVGFSHQKEKQDVILMPDGWRDLNIVYREFNGARYQLGTLGGGNHFIEIQKGSDNHIWFMIHSGSRNLGKVVADHYNKIAIKQNSIFYSEVKKEKQLAFLPIDSSHFNDYYNEMKYCVEFAFANRLLMMEKIKSSFMEVLGEIKFEDPINIAHNYARFENHFNQNVIVHRKGATSAKKGEIGIIPGSQGTKSYIVEGLGNDESFQSCSHGAGRLMSRTRAKKELNLEEEIKKMNDLGVIHGIKTNQDLDEAAGAYKDIDVVMENQKDLVKIIIKLKPLAVVKG